MSDLDFEEVYRLYFKDVFLFTKGLVKDERLAEEITQEIFVKAINNINRFDGRNNP